jgi:hypothetical protein
MKLALITDPKGFTVVNNLELSYHLVLAQYVRNDPKYADYYKDRKSTGDFIMLDNGAAENVKLDLHELRTASEILNPDEIILPDVLFDSEATFKASTHPDVTTSIPAVKRAVVPQGNTFDEWISCAKRLITAIEFRTLCIPKHTERFEGGRVRILKEIESWKWHEHYTVHLLGVWGSPIEEIRRNYEAAPWVRGIDTAAPFAWAQHGVDITELTPALHISHTWGKKFDKHLAYSNGLALLNAVWGME